MYETQLIDDKGYIETQDSSCRISSQFIDNEQIQLMIKQKKQQNMRQQQLNENLQKQVQKQGKYCKINVSQRIQNKTQEMLRQKSVLELRNQYKDEQFEADLLNFSKGMNNSFDKNNLLLPWDRHQKSCDASIISKNSLNQDQSDIDLNSLLIIKQRNGIVAKQNKKQTSPQYQKITPKSNLRFNKQEIQTQQNLDFTNNLTVKSLIIFEISMIKPVNFNIQDINNSSNLSRIQRIRQRNENDMIIKYFPK
uniref:Uncharacterized protein n=1 Tax=Spironucleus salmonicida TaxID=348837 RepID=V6LSH0_9EUKA|eukprot:EST47168.1 Hypothetical protein SS50377_12679 [Spironucleus salmonicida]